MTEEQETRTVTVYFELGGELHRKDYYLVTEAEVDDDGALALTYTKNTFSGYRDAETIYAPGAWISADGLVSS